MSHSQALGSPLRCIRQIRLARYPRNFTSASLQLEEAVQQETKVYPDIKPKYIGTKREERILERNGFTPVGSRRRRAALLSSDNIPFEQLPYQCFQEARKILAADREEKLKQIEVERRRIESVQSRDALQMGGEAAKKGKLVAMQKYLSELKILADINDPVIRKRFEDGHGDMNRPIYRHLAEKKWRSYKRLILVQRLTQMFVVPDILPHLDPTIDMSIFFGKQAIPSGAFVDSMISQRAPKLTVQVFDRGPRLVTVVVVDADVPNAEKDSFDARCHYIASNITISPTDTNILLRDLAEENVALPWMPPHAQKGSPYHRLAIFVLEQPDNKAVDVEALRQGERRLGFSLRSFNTRHKMKAVGATLFRNVWDENTAAIMKNLGLEGADIEFKRKKPEALPWQYNVKDGSRYR